MIPFDNVLVQLRLECLKLATAHYNQIAASARQSRSVINIADEMFSFLISDTSAEKSAEGTPDTVQPPVEPTT